MDVTDFASASVEVWRANCHLHRDAVCKKCQRLPAQILCVKCTQKLPTTALDGTALQIWRRNRDLSKKATCKKCAAQKGQKIARPGEDWKLASYRCATCGVTKAAKFYDYTMLKKVADEDKSYLAKCTECQPSMQIGKGSRMGSAPCAGRRKNAQSLASHGSVVRGTARGAARVATSRRAHTVVQSQRPPSASHTSAQLACSLRALADPRDQEAQNTK